MSKYGRRTQEGGASAQGTVRPGTRSLGGVGPVSLSPERNSLGSRVTHRARAQGTGTATERLCPEQCVPGPSGGLNSPSGKPTADFQHLGPVRFFPIPDTAAGASVPRGLLTSVPPLDGASLYGPSGYAHTFCPGPPPPKPAPSSPTLAGLWGGTTLRRELEPRPRRWGGGDG